MKKLSFVAILAVAAALLGGCVTETVRRVDPHVTLAGDVARRIYVTDVICARAQGGNLVLQANVVNQLSREIWIEYKVAWMDAAGVEIDSILSTWQRVAIPAHDLKSLKGIAPDLDAADARLYVREMQ